MPQKVRVAGRYHVPGADRGVGALLTAASWVLQRLPGEVVEHQRGACIEMVSRAQPLIIEVTPPTGVRIWASGRLLVELLAPADVPQPRDQASGRWARAG